MFSTSENIRPIWILYFNEISKKFTPLQLLANLFLFSPFSYKTFNWVDPFDLVYNEITFFIIGSILIYFSYKRCWRLDIINFRNICNYTNRLLSDNVLSI